MLFCECEAGDKLENTDARARRRSLTKSDTRSRLSRRCPRMCSSRRATSTTTDCGTHLRRPRRLLPWPCARPSSFGRGGFAAQSESSPTLDGRNGLLQSRVSGFGKQTAPTAPQSFQQFQVVKMQFGLMNRGINLKIEGHRLQPGMSCCANDENFRLSGEVCLPGSWQAASSPWLKTPASGPPLLLGWVDAKGGPNLDVEIIKNIPGSGSH